MVKVRAIAKIRPFIKDEQHDDAVSTNGNVISLKSARNSAERIQYRYVFSSYNLAGSCSTYPSPPAAMGYMETNINHISDFGACYDDSSKESGPKQLFESEIEPLLENAFEGKVRLSSCSMT